MLNADGNTRGSPRSRERGPIEALQVWRLGGGRRRDLRAHVSAAPLKRKRQGVDNRHIPVLPFFLDRDLVALCAATFEHVTHIILQSLQARSYSPRLTRETGALVVYAQAQWKGRESRRST